jgi:hypothetical protein
MVCGLFVAWLKRKGEKERNLFREKHYKGNEFFIPLPLITYNKTLKFQFLP